MRLRPRFAVAVVVLAATFAVPFLEQGSAVADSTTVAACSGSSGYPPTTAAQVQSSALTVTIGQHIKVGGVHFCGSESVRITIGGKFVGTGHTNSAGAFDPVVTVPGPAGNVQLCGVGASGLSTDASCIDLTVRASGSGGTSGSGGGSGTAMTGTDIALLVAIASILLTVGVALAATRRRSSVSP